MTRAAPSRAWLTAVLKPLRARFRELVVFSLFVNLLALAAPVFVLQVYDRVVFHNGVSTLQALTIGMLVAIAFDFILRQARSRLMQRVTIRIDAELGRRLLDKLNALPLRSLEKIPASEWLSLFRDADHVRNTLGGPTAVLMVDLPFAALFIGLIYVIAAPIVWVLVVALCAFLVLAILSSASVQAASLAERQEARGRDALVAELIAGRATVKALALGDALRPEWEERHARAIEQALRRGGRNDGFVNFGVGLSVLTTVGLTTVGALAILDQRMTIGALIAANMLSGRIIGPLTQLIGVWRNFATYREARRRLGRLFEMEEERHDSVVPFERPNGEVTVEALRYRFDAESEPAIESMDFTVKPGGLHGVVGRNGSGKSTLLKLMSGLYAPEKGRVLLDGADISQFTRSALSRWIGYVPQDTFLFAGSVRDNLAAACEDAPEDAVIDCARRVGLHDDIIDLPDGYATDVGEAGSRLSAGQRQRLAIARALLGDPPVLLLDEPTSNLDRQSEERLRSLLSQLAKDHNVVVVTHSPILLAACHNIIALERGRIALAGPSRDILPRLFGTHTERPPLERKA